MTTTFLTAGDLAGMRDILERSLPGTAVIHRNTQVTDGQGGRTDSWLAVGTTTCRISPSYRSVGDETTPANRLAAERQRLITLPANADVSELDRIIVSSVTYEVTGMDGPRSYELARRVQVVRV